jgi:hypothetical protein
VALIFKLDMATNTKKVIILIDGQNLYYNLKEMGVVNKGI